MKDVKEAILLRIFIGENDKIGPINVFEKIVVEARESQLAGATVYRGIMGFGANSRIHTSKLLVLSQDLPLVVEIVDSEQKINDFLPTINDILEKANSVGLITMEKAKIIKYFTSKN